MGGTTVYAIQMVPCLSCLEKLHLSDVNRVTTAASVMGYCGLSKNHPFIWITVVVKLYFCVHKWFLLCLRFSIILCAYIVVDGSSTPLEESEEESQEESVPYQLMMNEDEGHFQLGPSQQSNQIFLLSLTIRSAANLAQVRRNDLYNLAFKCSLLGIIM